MTTAESFRQWLKDNHTGKESAINARKLRHWGTPRELRFMVHDLRIQGVPICSGNEGYYYASTTSEVSQTLSFLNSIQDDLTKVINGLNGARASMRDAES